VQGMPVVLLVGVPHSVIAAQLTVDALFFADLIEATIAPVLVTGSTSAALKLAVPHAQ
jgi:hypothetical protein